MTANTLRTIRRRLGLTQVQFAKQIGITANSLARMERGELGMRPSTDKLIRLIARTSDLTAASKRKTR